MSALKSRIIRLTVVSLFPCDDEAVRFCSLYLLLLPGGLDLARNRGRVYKFLNE